MYTLAMFDGGEQKCILHRVGCGLQDLVCLVADLCGGANTTQNLIVQAGSCPKLQNSLRVWPVCSKIFEVICILVQNYEGRVPLTS